MQRKDNSNALLHYRVTMQVRDYECDTQGVVNNAVYLNYLEHARNQLFWNKGLSLTDLHAIGEDPVVAKIEVQYMRSLHARSYFYVDTQVETKGNFKLLFHQTILKGSSQQREQEANDIESIVHAKAIVTVAVLQQGSPTRIKNTTLYTALV